jgi:hypothetical protein
MGRKLNAQDIDWPLWQSPENDELTLYAAYAGAGHRDASALRRALQLPVSARVWHRVFPHLPREVRSDGSLILWHPDELGWAIALERVHARLALNGRKSGAYLLPPGSERVLLRDFHDFDDADLNDWSIAVPDAHFRALCGNLHGDLCRLSELVARWAVEVGPMRAGQALAARSRPPGQPLS